MLQALVSTATGLLQDLNQLLSRPSKPEPRPQPVAPPSPTKYEPLERLLLTDNVGRTLFEEYAAHRKAARGEEETGWVLLGVRLPREAIALATLPAGTQRDASTGHVLFNSSAQALGSRIVRQADRRLTILGMVHTHPGSLRHPSDGDFRGDSQWVRVLRGGEGVFGIGTADGGPAGDVLVEQPRPHVQRLGELCLSWYSLRHGEPGYRPLPIGLTLGPDLARPLHDVWEAVETHADRLERLYRTQAGVRIEVIQEAYGPRLALSLPGAEPNTAVRALLSEKEVRYFLVRDGDVLAAGLSEDRVDRGVHLLLAELAAQS